MTPEQRSKYETFAKVYNDLALYPDISAVSHELGMAARTIRSWASTLRRLRDEDDTLPALVDRSGKAATLKPLGAAYRTIETDLPSYEEPIEDLLKRVIGINKRYDAYHHAKGCVDIKVQFPGPYGVVGLPDNHLNNIGTSAERAFKDAAFIDDQLVIGAPLYSTSGSNRLFVIGDGLWGAKSYKVIVRSSVGVAGIWTDDRDAIEPPKIGYKPVCAITTDSYGQRDSTYSAYGLIHSFAHLLGAAAYGDPQGGTGFAQANGGYPKFADRMGVNMPQATAPSMYWAFGGINDPDSSLLNDGVTALVQQARSWWTDAVIGIVGPWCPNGANAQTAGGVYPNKRDRIKAALAAADTGPWVFIDPLTDSWYNSAGGSWTGSGLPWVTGSSKVTNNLSFTAAILAAESTTLSSNWTGTTGTYSVLFSDGNLRTVTLTNGATTATWTGQGAVTGTPYAWVVASATGNSAMYVDPDGTHMAPPGMDFLIHMSAMRGRQAILAL